MSDDQNNQGTVFGYSANYARGRFGLLPDGDMDVQYVAGAINRGLRRQREAAERKAAEREARETEARWRASIRNVVEPLELPVLPDLNLVPVLYTPSPALPYAEIDKVRVDYGAQQNGEKGMAITATFTAHNVGGQLLRLAALFYQDEPGIVFRGKRDGQLVRTDDLSYRTRSGELSTWHEQNALYADTTFTDVQLFLPYNALPQDKVGRHSYKFDVHVVSKKFGQILASSDMVRFHHTVSPGAEIGKVWTDHNVTGDAQQGMRIHTAFGTDHLKGENLEVIAFFGHDSVWKSSLVKAAESVSGDFKTVSGELCVERDCAPSYEFSTFADFKLFLPYDALPQEETGTHNYKFNVQVRSKNSGEVFASSEWLHFSHTVSPGADIYKVWADHNVVRNDQNGMLIHTDFGTSHLKGEDLEVITFFYHANDQSSSVRVDRSVNAGFRTVANELCVCEDCTPLYPFTTFDDFKLFLPYNVIPQKKGSTHEYEFGVQVRSKRSSRIVASSESQSFRLET